MSNPFTFNQFSIKQEKSAMKVGTDGVLLGAWGEVYNVKNALDIGCGTGLIALMIAQKNRNCSVDAVEIDKNSADEAKFNVENSIFNNRICVYNSSIQYFTQNCVKKYDLIVSNPPYFVNSLKSPDTNRSTARHNTDLTYGELFVCVEKLLTKSGSFSMILPFEQIGQVLSIAQNLNLFLTKKTDVYPTPISVVSRCLLTFSKNYKPFFEDKIIVEISRHVYSEDYKRLTKDFYLKFKNS
jgi:tRNA1Val (adenine37-N6)-methyltransferase